MSRPPKEHRTTTKSVVWGGDVHDIPDDYDLIIRCKLRPGDKTLKPWGEWEPILKNMYGVNTYKPNWDGTYVIRKKRNKLNYVDKLVNIILRTRIKR